MIDFAKTKIGFKVATFGTPVSAAVSKLTIKTPTGAGPSGEVLAEFIRREYPSFFQD